MVKKGYLAESQLAKAHKQKTEQQCALCHETATAPHGECTRGAGCLRDVGGQKKVTYLGVSVGAVPQAVRQHVKLPSGVGLMIESVEPGSPAAEVHLRAYDILEKLDQQLLVNQEQFSTLIRTYQSGGEVSLQLIRASEPKTLQVKLGDRVVDYSLTADLAQEHTVLAGAVDAMLVEQAKLHAIENLQAEVRQPGKVTYLGINTSSPPEALAEQLKLAKGLYLVIDSVEPASPAASAGLRHFDVLQKLDDQLLVNSEQLTVLIRNRRPKDEVELTLLREGRPLKVGVALGERQVGEAEIGSGQAIADFDDDGDLDIMLLNGKLSEAMELSMRGDVKDEEFVRRVYLDLVGTPPQPQEITHFAVDPRPNKRQQLIDALLSRPQVIDRIGTSNVLHWSDSEHSLVLTTMEDGQKWLLARDQQGNTVFDGSVASDDERHQLAPPLAAKLGLMLKGLAAVPATGSPADAAVALERVVARFEAREQTFDQALDLLRRETGLNIVVDRKGLAAAGVKLDEPLSLDLHDVRAQTVLKTLLLLVGGPSARLKHEIDDGVVLITAVR
ncbi:MAG TPA: PDZ domain-containing protein [Pirellulales bacterium]|nr:PDZ domain-containing protein [Pirellulales bacterium]